MIRLISIAVISFLAMVCVAGEESFTIQSIEYHQKQPRKDLLLFPETETAPGIMERKAVGEFVPCLEAKMAIRDLPKSGQLVAKAYFYSSAGVTIEDPAKPVLADRGDKKQHDLPVFLPNLKTDSVFFIVPEKVRQLAAWQAVVVFGDSNETASKVYPANAILAKLDYPEKRSAVEKKTVPSIESKMIVTDFFTLQGVEYHAKQTRKNILLFLEKEKAPGAKSVSKEGEFVPCLEARVSVREQTKSNGLFGKVYFYTKTGGLLEEVAKPAIANRGEKLKYDWPAFLPKGKAESIYFPVSEKVLKFDGWQALVVFGDANEAVAKLYSETGQMAKLDYPEKDLVEKKAGARVERQAMLDPVVEHVVKTDNPKQPQITLLVRPPIGMTDTSEAKGVLAMCLLGNSVQEIKRKLQNVEPGQEVGGLLKFAEEHRLVILCWGSRPLWDVTKNWDEQDKRVVEETNLAFNDLVRAWSKGVDELSRKYGFPKKNFLLWGISASAQYSIALAVRKPEYFLAAHVHVPSSFDKPTPEANRVLWCLTTGELEGGYERSKRFYARCRELGYPIVYKAFIGLGHAGHPSADKLGLRFFEYALALQERREALEKSLGGGLGMTLPDKSGPIPWLQEFRNPPFVGDIVNQIKYPASESKKVPLAFWVALPTPDIAEAWDKK